MTASESSFKDLIFTNSWKTLKQVSPQGVVENFRILWSIFAIVVISLVSGKR